LAHSSGAEEIRVTIRVVITSRAQTSIKAQACHTFSRLAVDISHAEFSSIILAHTRRTATRIAKRPRGAGRVRMKNITFLAHSSGAEEIRVTIRVVITSRAQTSIKAQACHTFSRLAVDISHAEFSSIILAHTRRTATRITKIFIGARGIRFKNITFLAHKCGAKYGSFTICLCKACVAHTSSRT